jgi:hypothetical protein
MKMEAYIKAIPELPKSLGASADDAHRAAVAITTTDLVSKEAALQVILLHNRYITTGITYNDLIWWMWEHMLFRGLGSSGHHNNRPCQQEGSAEGESVT